MKLERIGNIAKFINGAAFKPEDWNSDGLRIIRIQNLTNPSKPYNYTTRKVDDKYLVKRGDVLVSWSAIIDVFIWNDDEALLNQHIFKVEFDEKKVDKYYFIFALKHTIDDLSKLAHGSTMRHVVKGDFENHKIYLPPLLYQKQIANILSKSETLIQQRKESIVLLDEFIKSTFYKMFGDPVRNEKKWQLVSLSQLGSLDRGVSKNRPRNAPELLGGKYPLIQTGEVSNSGLFIKKYKNTYSELGLKQSKLWNEGTMLITIAANIAQTSILSFKACFPDSIVGFISNKKESNVIYVHHLFSFLQKMLEYNAPSSAQKNINLKILRELIVPKPPLDLQNQFATIVEKAEVLKSQFKESLNELENLFGALSRKAFNGELKLGDIDSKEERGITIIQKGSNSSHSLSDLKLDNLDISEVKEPAIFDKKEVEKEHDDYSKQIDSEKMRRDHEHDINLAWAYYLLRDEVDDKKIENEKVEKSKITWEQVNFQQVSNWLKDKYTGYHFNSAMLFRFLMEEHVIFPNYFSSEELKTNPKLNEADDVKSFIFSALNNENPFVKLEQVFYDESVKNNIIKLSDEDIEYFEKNKLKVNSGIYFKIVE